MIPVDLVVCFPVLLLKRESNLDYLDFWTSILQVPAEQVDVVLGKMKMVLFLLMRRTIRTAASSYRHGLTRMHLHVWMLF